MVLMEPYLGKGHVLYTDNFYTSPPLAKHFLSKDTHLYGTIKENCKNLCTDIVTEQLTRDCKGTAVFYKCKETEIGAVKYRAIKDKSSKKSKVVYMLTTCQLPTMLEVDAYHPEGHAVFKPEAIKAYNHQMGGVDMVDQQLHSICTFHKTYKWYRKLAIRLISQAILNAHKVYQCITGSEKSFLEFLHDTITLLVTQTTQIEYHKPSSSR